MKNNTKVFFKKWAKDVLFYLYIYLSAYICGFFTGRIYANSQKEITTNEKLVITQTKSAVESSHVVIKEEKYDAKNIAFVEKFYNHDGSLSRSIYRGVAESTAEGINTERAENSSYQENDAESYDITTVTKSRPISRLMLSGFAPIDNLQDVQLQIGFLLLHAGFATYQTSMDFSKSLVGAGAFIGPRLLFAVLTDPHKVDDVHLQLGFRLFYNTYLQAQAAYNFSDARIGLGVLF